MKTILAFGDSLTWGFKAGSWTRHAYMDRWPNVLQAGLAKCRVIEEGHNGRTTIYDDGTCLDNRKGSDALPILLMVGLVGWNYGPSGTSLPDSMRLLLWVIAALVGPTYAAGVTGSCGAFGHSCARSGGSPSPTACASSFPPMRRPAAPGSTCAPAWTLR